MRSRIVAGLHPASKGRFTRPSQPPFQHEPLPAVPARLAHGLCASPNHPQPLLAPHPNPLANLMPTSPSTVPTVSRPWLKMTRHDDRQPPGDVSFEVWNPIAARYEPKASLNDGLNRVNELAEHVRVMWVQRDPARTFLKDAPDPADDTEWAELRVNCSANQLYETRTFDQHGWKEAMSRCAAVETICNDMG